MSKNYNHIGNNFNMSNSKAVHQRHCFILSLTFLVLKAISSTKLVFNLIHRDAIFLRPSALLSHDDIRGPLIPDQEGALFLVNISIGEPPVPQLLAMDTGSPLTWVHRPLCVGCTPASSAIYDPKVSSTCRMLPCDNTCQNYISAPFCGPDYKCRYSVTYLEGSTAKGILAFEKFKFVTSTGGEWEIPDLSFGYGLESSGLINRLTGILGLEVFSNSSLVARVGNKFSYCIGNISDPLYAYNRLSLGEGGVFKGYSTPLEIWEGHYAVSLKGISVGEKKLSVNQKEEFDFRVVIDSGTTLTYLERSVVEQMKQEVMSLLNGHLQRVVVNDNADRLCYEGDLRRDLGGFPIVTLRLAEGAEIYLNVESVFRRLGDNIFCMAVDVSASASGMNIIGVYAQQYYNIGFDLNAMRVSFMSIECELLDD